MIKFNKIEIESFKGIFHCILDFNNLNNNFYFLEGKNNLSKFATSNGSGKSTLVSAIMFALYGATDDIYVKKSEYQNKNTNIKMCVKLNLTIQNIQYSVERTNDSFKLFKDGKDISELTKTNTEKKFQDILNLNKNEFTSFTYLSQSGSSSFLSKTPSEKLSCIKDFIFGEELSSIQSKIDNLVKSIKDSITVLNVQITGIESNIETLKDLAEKQVKQEKFPYTLEEYKKQKEKLQLEYNRLEDLSREETKQRLEIKHTKDVINNLIDKYKKVKESRCPTCGQNLIDDSLLKQTVSDINKLKQKTKEIKENYVNIKSQLDDSLKSDIYKNLQDITNIITKIEYQNKLRDTKDNIEQKIQQNNIELSKLIDNKQDSEFKLKQLTQLQTYFKNTFIQQVQQSFLTEIQTYLNMYCYDVFGEDFNLKFSGNNLDLTIGGKPYSYYSGGERERIDFLFVLAIKVALNNFTDKCTNLFICDESLSGQDTEAFENCLSLINSLTSAEGITTILVSHRDVEYQTNKIIIERFKDKTKLTVVDNI